MNNDTEPQRGCSRAWLAAVVAGALMLCGFCAFIPWLFTL